MAILDNKEAYNVLTSFDEISKRCIELLMDETNGSQMVWKLLKYNDRDAWNKTNLTQDEKRALIYAGQENQTLYRVFSDIGQNDAWKNEDTIIRIAPHSGIGKNRTIGVLMVSFETYSHYKINTLSNYKTRVDMIIQEFFRVFNGSRVGGLGQLFFDGLRDPQDRFLQSGQIPFRGKQLFMSVNIS